jgi:hypothetical protein
VARKKQKTLWVFDCETDPFKNGRDPRPFLFCAVSDKGDRVEFWGDECIDKFLHHVEDNPNGLWYAHHGGKFDTLFLSHEIRGQALIVAGRILKCTIRGGEFRDSMAILPMPLKKLNKTSSGKIKISLDKLEKEKRDFHRAEITRYCYRDCDVLLESLEHFFEQAGARKLTIASVASQALRKFYPDIPKITKEAHYNFFSKFYYGGRVQCFEKGELSGNFTLYDINSMYPFAMKKYNHPVGEGYNKNKFTPENLPENQSGFFSGTCDTDGCFPIRDEKGNTPYTAGKNLFVNITLHELHVAQKLGIARNFSGDIFTPIFQTNFSLFVDFYYEKRLYAKACCDEKLDIFYKLILNSSYGRFAMSPYDRFEYYFCDAVEKDELIAVGWIIDFYNLEHDNFILKRELVRDNLTPQEKMKVLNFFEDVATGASITGAARAELMRSLHYADRPIYCDTDSILCEKLHGLIDGKKLGGWKIETECATAFVAGKKMYALYKGAHVVKKACKGVRLTGKEIAQVARGAIVEYINAAPSIKIDGSIKYISRRIRRT